MISNDIFTPKQRKFLDYILSKKEKGECQLPSLSVLSRELEISNTTLREILEMVRTLGIIEAHPRSGIELLPYSFKPPVVKSLCYASMEDRNKFNEFADLRMHLEKAYFPQAVKLLTHDNLHEMMNLIKNAQEKLGKNPIQIPHSEHRKLHLSIYQNIHNEYVTSLLEAYWVMYESVGLDLYTDYSYLVKVWNYHEMIVEEIAKGCFEKSFELLIEHMELIKDIQVER